MKKKENHGSNMKNRWRRNNESLKNKKRRMSSGEYLQKKKGNKNYRKKGYSTWFLACSSNATWCHLALEYFFLSLSLPFLPPLLPRDPVPVLPFSGRASCSCALRSLNFDLLSEVKWSLEGLGREPFHALGYGSVGSLRSMPVVSCSETPH